MWRDAKTATESGCWQSAQWADKPAGTSVRTHLNNDPDCMKEQKVKLLCLMSLLKRGLKKTLWVRRHLLNKGVKSQQHISQHWILMHLRGKLASFRCCLSGTFDHSSLPDSPVLLPFTFHLSDTLVPNDELQVTVVQNHLCFYVAEYKHLLKRIY